MNYTGTKYDKDMDITDVAKAVRKNIKQAMKDGWIKEGTKISVKCRRYAGGQGLDVVINYWDGTIHNREWVREHVNMEPHEEDRFTLEAGLLVKYLEDIVSAYNYDKSDPITDYFDVNFHGSVAFDTAVNNAQFEAVVAELNAEKRETTKERKEELAEVALNLAKTAMAGALRESLKAKWHTTICAEVVRAGIVYPSTMERTKIKEMIECEITNVIEYVLTDDMRN